MFWVAFFSFQQGARRRERERLDASISMARETVSQVPLSALLLPYGGSAGVYATLAKIVLDETLAAHTAREQSRQSLHAM